MRESFSCFKSNCRCIEAVVVGHFAVDILKENPKNGDYGRVVIARKQSLV